MRDHAASRLPAIHARRIAPRAPSWLRACHGPCEATGAYAVIDPTTADVDQYLAWSRAHHAAGFHVCDGWHVIRCAECDGTGRAPWLVTGARALRWLWRGLMSTGRMG